MNGYSTVTIFPKTKLKYVWLGKKMLETLAGTLPQERTLLLCGNSENNLCHTKSRMRTVMGRLKQFQSYSNS